MDLKPGQINKDSFKTDEFVLDVDKFLSKYRKHSIVDYPLFRSTYGNKIFRLRYIEDIYAYLSSPGSDNIIKFPVDCIIPIFPNNKQTFEDGND